MKRKLIVFSILTAALLTACGEGGDRNGAALARLAGNDAAPGVTTSAPVPTMERQPEIVAPTPTALPPSPTMPSAPTPTAWVVVVTAEPPPVIVSPVETVRPAQPCTWRTVTPYDGAGDVNPNDVIAGFCD